MRCFLSLSFSKAMMRVEGFFFFYTHMWIDFTASALFKEQKRIANCVERPSKRKREQLNNERIWRSVLNYLNLHLFLFATSRMN